MTDGQRGRTDGLLAVTDSQPTGRHAAPEVATGASSLAHACEPVASGDVSGTPSSTATPRRSTRLIGIDAARGVALVGMMVVHVIDPVAADGTPSLAWGLAAGKSAALFALLAGVGVAFSSGRRRPPTGRREWTAHAGSLVVRAVLIAMVGLVLGQVVPDTLASVILPYYALLFLLAIPLLSLSIRTLLVVAAAIVVGMPVLSHLLRSGIEPVEVGNATFGDMVGDPGRLLTELALTGTYPASSWLAYLCVGMAVGRALLTSRRVVATIVLIGVGLTLGARLLSWFLLDVVGGRTELEAAALQSMSEEEYSNLLLYGASGVTPSDSWWWLATMPPHSSTPLDFAFTIGVALAVLGVCILIGRTTTFWLRPVAATGSMTLTLYCFHLLMLSSPFMPEGQVASLWLQVAAVVAFALVWSRFHARGPLEDGVAAATGATRRRILSGLGGREGR